MKIKIYYYEDQSLSPKFRFSFPIFIIAENRVRMEIECLIDRNEK